MFILTIYPKRCIISISNEREVNTMTRKELANKVFDILRTDMQLISKTDEELWKSIAETDDNTLLTFLDEAE
jgi:hypothetical protein